MRYKFIRFFFDANPTPSGGDPNPTPAPAPNPAPQPTPEPANTEARIKELEAKIVELTKKPEPAPTPQPAPNAEVPEYVKKQNELIEKLLNTVTTLQGEKTVSTRRSLLETELKAIDGLPQEHIEEIVDNFNGRSFKDDAEFETFKKGKIEKAKTIAQNTSSSSLSIFGRPAISSGNSKKTLSPAEQRYIDNMKANKN